MNNKNFKNYLVSTFLHVYFLRHSVQINSHQELFFFFAQLDSKLQIAKFSKNNLKGEALRLFIFQFRKD